MVSRSSTTGITNHSSESQQGQRVQTQRQVVQPQQTLTPARSSTGSFTMEPDWHDARSEGSTTDVSDVDSVTRCVILGYARYHSGEGNPQDLTVNDSNKDVSSDANFARPCDSLKLSDYSTLKSDNASVDAIQVALAPVTEQTQTSQKTNEQEQFQLNPTLTESSPGPRADSEESMGNGNEANKQDSLRRQFNPCHQSSPVSTPATSVSLLSSKIDLAVEENTSALSLSPATTDDIQPTANQEDNTNGEIPDDHCATNKGE